ncbi:hypothetical protein [Pseudomonas veronii]|uniref:hypothetical protein n=1 Tax=Pseudomonas veronii TaxID=76761 RepID=UPI002D7846A2|nr:hypothetical protein [Pseudomonas veronii]WRU61182.1 hypothetical protein VPH48_23570 [Pseudomonas veronii]
MLVSWFYLSAYTNAFGTTARNSQRALTDLNSYLQTGNLAWSLNQGPAVLPLEGIKVNLNAGRIKTWVLALAARLEVSKIKFYKGSEKRLIPIRPKEFIRHERRPGFYFLLGDKPSKNFEISSLSENEASAHFVTPELLDLYLDGQYVEFARLREALMFSWEIENLIEPAAKSANFVIESGTKIY